MASQLQDLKDVLITKEVENLNLNVNSHSKYMENGTILAPRILILVNLITLCGAQPKHMQTKPT